MEKDTLHDFIHMWNLKQNKTTKKTKEQTKQKYTHRYTEWINGYQRAMELRDGQNG